MKSSELQRKIAEHCPVVHEQNHRVDRVREFFREYTERQKVLDVGCADGSVLAEFVGRHELHGVDVSPNYLAGALALGYHARVHDVETDPLPYHDGTFDVVYAGETIEHLIDTDWFLAEVNRVLKAGGHFILTYPNVRTLTSLAMMALADLPPMYSARYRGPHYRDFTRRTMLLALTNHHFRVTRIEGTHFHVPGLGDLLPRLASRLPAWASQVVLRAVKTAVSHYSLDKAADVNIYHGKER